MMLFVVPPSPPAGDISTTTGDHLSLVVILTMIFVIIIFWSIGMLAYHFYTTHQRRRARHRAEKDSDEMNMDSFYE